MSLAPSTAKEEPGEWSVRSNVIGNEHDVEGISVGWSTGVVTAKTGSVFAPTEIEPLFIEGSSGANCSKNVQPLPLAGDFVLIPVRQFAATMLGDFGAEVIKVEQPGRGDALRGSPVNGKANRSGNWLVEGRNKKSVTLNLRVPEGQAILKELGS